MARMIEQPGWTFDDVLLVPQKSEIIPKDVELKTRLSRQVSLNIPIVGAAMDRVTESKMAIALARAGGIGVIHKNMPSIQQADEVRRVKRASAIVIDQPICLDPKGTVADAKGLMLDHKISGIPVVRGKKLVGIVTRRDLASEPDDSDKAIAQVMTTELVTVRVESVNSVDQLLIQQVSDELHRYRIEKMLLVDSDFNLLGLITARDIKHSQTYPQALTGESGRYRVAAAVGVGSDLDERAKALIEAGVNALVIDTAHGHSRCVLAAVPRLKKIIQHSSRQGQVDIIAGNIATAEAAQDLIEAGVDAVKVGVGPGSICTTRVVTGCGVPQLTAIIWAAEVCQKHNIPLIADGGIKQPGDIVKALAAGADSVMLGNMLAGTAEAPGETILHDGRAYKLYRGMGSVEAMRTGRGDRYHQAGQRDEKKLVPEGLEGRVPFRGSVFDLLYQVVNSVKSGFGYCGAKNLAALHEQAQFIQITAAGQQESGAHDVIVTSQPPNLF